MKASVRVRNIDSENEEGERVPTPFMEVSVKVPGRTRLCIPVLGRTEKIGPNFHPIALVWPRVEQLLGMKLRWCPHCEGHGSYEVHVAGTSPELDRLETCPCCRGDGFLDDNTARCGRCGKRALWASPIVRAGELLGNVYGCGECGHEWEVRFDGR